MPHNISHSALASLLVFAVTFAVAAAWVDEYKSGIIWPEPPVINPGTPTTPPSDAVVLFDGKDLTKWEGGENWIIERRTALAIASCTSSSPRPRKSKEKDKAAATAVCI
jgi:hypothetical protein